MKISGLPDLRWHFLVLSALFCLCVSDSVGPRLVPLPQPTEVLSAAVVPDISSHFFAFLPEQNRQPSRFVEIAGPQFRSGDHYNHTHHDTELAKSGTDYVAVGCRRSRVLVPTISSASGVQLSPDDRAPPPTSN